MYADKITPAMQQAIEETQRRRTKQIAYNKKHGINPQPLRKKIADVTDMLAREDIDTQDLLATGYRNNHKNTQPKNTKTHRDTPKPNATTTDLTNLIEELTQQMHTAATNLQFELAARLRDELKDLKKELRTINQVS